MIDTQAGLKLWQASILYGGLVELVDTLDLGSSALCACEFESHVPYLLLQDIGRNYTDTSRRLDGEGVKPSRVKAPARQFTFLKIFVIIYL